jgi:lipid-A-disaccharide synthase-like uncharacterized protein
MGPFVSFLFQYVDIEKNQSEILRLLFWVSGGVMIPAIGIGMAINYALPFDMSLFIVCQVILLIVGVNLVAIHKYKRALQVLSIIAVGLVLVFVFIHWGRTEWSNLNLIATCAQFYLGVRTIRYDL